jgi:hypothetical protein
MSFAFSLQTQDVQRLLDTRGGDYAAACSLDFSKPPAFYDTFALRDSDDHAALMQSWPYFRSRASRDALKASEPVPVTSCWNGIGMSLGPPLETSCTSDQDTNKPTSRNGRRTLLRRSPTSALQRHTRLLSNLPPRRLRVLSDPHRQLPLSRKRRVAEPERPRRLQLSCVRSRQSSGRQSQFVGWYCHGFARQLGEQGSEMADDDLVRGLDCGTEGWEVAD